jgi:HSP20 family protein
MKKPSLIERLTGSSNTDDYGDYFDDERPSVFGGAPAIHDEGVSSVGESRRITANIPGNSAVEWKEGEDDIGELAVDVYQTQDSIVIKTLVAGVLPTNVDINVSRDMLTIRGTREDEREVEDSNYFQKELYWGSFSRTILLPEEVDVDAAEASEKHGVLIIRLPKINKSKSTKLRVKSR